MAVNTDTNVVTNGLNKLKEIDISLYNKLQRNSLFVDFFKVLFLLEQMDSSSVKKIALFILNHFCDVNTHDGRCAICLECCLEDECIKSNSCIHVFHKECYNEWLKINISCPQCRTNPFSIPY
jgi:hypothetical protein